MNANDTLPIPRDSEATRQKLIRAVGRLLARKGFRGVGVNAVARAAGVDKVLIYRYFGGLPGLIKAFGQESDFWPGPQELAGGDMAAFLALPLPDRLARLARNYLEAISSRPVTQEIMAWEMVERNELTVMLEEIREQSFLAFFRKAVPESPPGVDTQALAAIVGATVNYLVTRSRHTRWFSGIDLASEGGWDRLMNTLEQVSRGLILSPP
ncbi:MAG: helix-turn-helix domain-containing protein [Pseudomonadota bacterium]